MKQGRLVLFSLFILMVQCSTVSHDIYSLDKETSAYISGRTVKLFASEKIFVECIIKDDSIYALKLVKNITDSTRTIAIDFKYDKVDADSLMILHVTNPFKKVFKFEARVKPVAKRDYFYTHIMPVNPKIQSVSVWPYKIDCIILFDFKLNDPELTVNNQ